MKTTAGLVMMAMAMWISGCGGTGSASLGQEIRVAADSGPKCFDPQGAEVSCASQEAGVDVVDAGDSGEALEAAADAGDTGSAADSAPGSDAAPEAASCDAGSGSGTCVPVAGYRCSAWIGYTTDDGQLMACSSTTTCLSLWDGGAVTVYGGDGGVVDVHDLQLLDSCGRPAMLQCELAGVGPVCL